MLETMPTLAGYRVMKTVYDGTKTLIYQAIRESDNQPVMIKCLKKEYPTFNELVRFRNQYTIAENLDLDGIIRTYSLEPYGNGLALIMEDMGGISLSEYTGSQPLPLSKFFEIAIKIVQALEALYSNRVLHKDIKPQNILIHPKTQQIKLIDFSIASLLSRETQEIQSPDSLEGTLAYMSPEQTGRMNRGIDYRTDFYSLGVTFYQLLTGQLPFQINDPMELVHCHIAQSPKPPIKLNSDIPSVVNDIILKLMAKAAEDRYQSAFGLKYDLEKCQQQWQHHQYITSFQIGQRDLSDRFQIPEKLYGREPEVTTLLAAFDRVSQGRSEMMLVAGFSGIGKTALVNEIHKPIVRRRGYFIKGKFDQFKRDIPFSALVQAFQSLMLQLLTESAEQVQTWRSKIQEALGSSGQIIIEVIPELEQIIGPQSQVPTLEGSAAQNRFNLLFQKFINIFTTCEHPLVIFLDDLQWIDSASLTFMQLLMSKTENHSLLLLGAYRDNEVSPVHPLMLTLNEIHQTTATVNELILGPLNFKSLNHLIADTLSCPLERAEPLTKLVTQKTQGNPFFTNQFLKFLHEEDLISFDLKAGYWQCDIAQVKARAVTDDVVEFMAGQLQKLPKNTQNALKLAACIGNQFDLATLAIVSDNSQTKTAANLWKALQTGLVIPQSEVYKFFQDSDAIKGLTQQTLSVSYKFLHDRVQQAAYSLISDDQKSITHLKIGQQIKAHTPTEVLDENIFDIVNQLNLGAELLTEQSERDELAQLNLKAGSKARKSTAYAAANRYLTVGIDLLSANSWQSHYELTLALYESAAEAAYLSGDFTQQEQLTEVVLSNAKSLLDKIKIFEVQNQAYLAQHQQRKVLDTMFPVLKQLGVAFPEQPTPQDIEAQLQETQQAWQGKTIESLGDLPLMTGKNEQAAMRILSVLVGAAYEVAPEFFPLIICKQVILSINHGNVPISAYSYASYGVLQSNVLGEIETGYQFGQLALTLLEKFNANELKAKVIDVVEVFVKHWKVHFRQTLKPLLEGYQSGLEVGDFEFAGYCAFQYGAHSYYSGKELSELEKDMANYTEVFRQIKQEISINYNEIYRQAILNLLGKADDPTCLMGDACDEKTLLPLAQQNNDVAVLFFAYFQKIFLSYLFQAYSQTIEYVTLAEPYMAALSGKGANPLIYLCESLARLAVYPEASEEEQSAHLEKVQANQEKMHNLAHHAPMNHQHKFHLVEAERFRVLGQQVKAMDYYEQAIKGAKDNGFKQEEAIANELAAQFYFAWGKDKVAKTHLVEAYYAYMHWGAKAKVEALEKRYPQLQLLFMAREQARFAIDNVDEAMSLMLTVSSTTTDDFNLDLRTILKASQLIAGEIHFEKLLATLMQVIIENAGAETGILILQRNDQWVIEAKSSKKGSSSNKKTSNEVTVLQFLPIEQSQELPLTIVNYVLRTRETQVIYDTVSEMKYTQDPYLQIQKPKSVLCAPIINQGHLLGAIYLENNFLSGAFTPDRLEILKILSSQAAVSLENALLYQTLEQKVVERTEQLANANEQLAQANEEIHTLNEQLKAENMRMKAELEVSRQLQQMLLPKTEELSHLENLEIAGFMEPADEVGGDYYDVFEHDGHIICGIGDVTGHGLESGALAIMVQALVRGLIADNETDQVKFFNAINETVYSNVQRLKSDKNITLALLDYQNGILHLSGQHEEMIVVRGGHLERINTLYLGFPVGMIEDIAEFVDQTKVSLESGDVVVLYSDGITEAENPTKEEYGIERLCEVVQLNWQRSAKEIQQTVIDDVRQYIGHQRLLDDITLLVLKQK
jgi:predicted ATPase/serine phosphatase RsbU (regulator of sigma subunit)